MGKRGVARAQQPEQHVFGGWAALRALEERYGGDDDAQAGGKRLPTPSTLAPTPEPPVGPSRQGARPTSRASAQSSRPASRAADSQPQQPSPPPRRERGVAGEEEPRVKTADLVKSCATVAPGVYAADEGNPGLELARLRRNESESHERCLNGLHELSFLKSELDLNFQTVLSVPGDLTAFHQKEASRPASEGITGNAGGAVERGVGREDIKLQLEATGSSYVSSGCGSRLQKAQGLILRSPWMWEMRVEGQTATACTAQEPDVRRSEAAAPSSARKQAVQPLPRAERGFGTGSSGVVPFRSSWLGIDQLGDDPIVPPPRRVGDGPHSFVMDLVERSPQTLILRRVRPQAEGHLPPAFATGCGSTGSGETSSVRGKHAPAETLDGLAAAAMAADEQAQDLERSFLHRAQERSREAFDGVKPAQVERRRCKCGNTFKADSMYCRKCGRKRSDAEMLISSEAEVHDAIVEKRKAIAIVARDTMATFIRDFRSALRLVANVVPAAARVLEGALKGLIVTMDVEMTTTVDACTELEAVVDIFRNRVFEEKELKAELEACKAKVARYHETAARERLRHEEEIRALQARNGKLSDELARLAPEDNLEAAGVGKLMGDYSKLMDEMEDECTKQRTILGKLSVYTSDVLDFKASKRTPLAETGRVVELQTGEILIRPYDTSEKETQVTALDIYSTMIDDRTPVRLRTRKVREILARFEGIDVPEVSVETLCIEIDRIYSAKIAADVAADQSRTPRRELVDFVVDFYLEDAGILVGAQEKLCGILRALMKLERAPSTAAPPPMKVVLFARFLQFCEPEQSLPGTVLSTVLQTKRYAQAAHSHGGDTQQQQQQQQSQQQGQGRKDVVVLPPEARLAVASAHESGERALSGTLGAMSAAACQFFAAIARFSEVESFDPRRWHSRDFVVFVHLVHSFLHQELAPRFRELIARAEQRTAIPVDDFRIALRDVRLQLVDEGVWRAKLLPQSAYSAGGTTSATIAADTMLEYFGGGSSSRLPHAVLTESALLTAVTEAMTAEYVERARPIRRLWERRVSSIGCERLQYKDMRTVILSADPSVAASELRALYQYAVELDCTSTKVEQNNLPPFATDALTGNETITWEHVHHAALALRCLMGSHHTSAQQAAMNATIKHAETVSELGAEGPGVVAGRESGRSRKGVPPNRATTKR